jgi:hypothetical protein
MTKKETVMVLLYDGRTEQGVAPAFANSGTAEIRDQNMLPKEQTRSDCCAPDQTAQGGLTAEKVGILLREALPLLRQIVGGKDGGNRADGNARAAIDALDRVDKQLIHFSVLRFILLGVNAIHRAGVHTGSVFRSDTGFRDHVSHENPLPE